MIEEYRLIQHEREVRRAGLSRLRHTPALTLDGQKVELLANIELPDDAKAALEAGAAGVGLFRSEFLFMGRRGELPDEEEQYLAYRRAVEGMHGRPVTIRTMDVGADKPLDDGAGRGETHLNPALGLRAIRLSLADPGTFLTQLRAIMRSAAHGPVNLLIPMLAHASEIRQTLALVETARKDLQRRGVAHGPVQLGAMIEIPAAALTLQTVPEALRLPVDRHQRPDPVHAGDRPRRRGGRAPVRPLAPGRAAAGGRHYRPLPRAGQGRERLRRNGGRPTVTRLLLGAGAAQLLDASGADSGGEAGSAAQPIRDAWVAALCRVCSTRTIPSRSFWLSHVPCRGEECSRVRRRARSRSRSFGTGRALGVDPHTEACEAALEEDSERRGSLTTSSRNVPESLLFADADALSGVAQRTCRKAGLFKN